jgi:hypothetical protein
MERGSRNLKRHGSAIELTREQAMLLIRSMIKEYEFIQNNNFILPDRQHTLDVTPLEVGGMISLLRLGIRIHQKREMCNPADQFFVLLPVLHNQDYCMVVHFYWNQESAKSPKDSKGRFNLACGVISFHMHTQTDRRSGKSCSARMSATASLIRTSDVTDPELLAKLTISRDIMENDISLPRRKKLLPIEPIGALREAATLAPISASMQALIDASREEFVAPSSVMGSHKRKCHSDPEATEDEDDPEATEDEDDPEATEDEDDPEATEDESVIPCSSGIAISSRKCPSKSEDPDETEDEDFSEEKYRYKKRHRH